MLIESVIVPEGRKHRDFSALAESIAEVGLINPISITPKHVLVAGYHRLLACKQLGWTDIPACILSIPDVDRELATLDENLMRNEYPALERSEMFARRKALYLAKHPETKHGSGPGRGHKEKRDPIAGSLSFVTDSAQKTGKSRATISADVQIAESLPEAVKKLVRETDVADSKKDLLALARLKADPKKQLQVAKEIGAGRAKTVTEAMRHVRRDELQQEAVPLPEGKYRVIYADPPWQYNDSRGGLDDYADSAAEGQYPTMPTKEICELPIKELAADDSVLFCWATFPLLTDALEVVKAWGFKYKTAFVWNKTRPNFGHYHNANAELLIVATRGSCVPEADKREHQVQTIERVGRHSEKPEAFREMIDRMYPQRPGSERLELFRRGSAPAGWKVWGNEACQ